MPQQKKLKILIIQPWISYRGAESVSVAQAYWLAKRGYRTEVVAVWLDEERMPLYSDEVSFCVAPRWLGDLCRRDRRLMLVLGPWALLWLVLGRVRRGDVLNPHNLPSSWIAVLVGKLRGCPVVWTCHGVPSWGGFGGLFERFIWLVGSSFLDRWVVRAADSIIAVSDEVADDVWERYKRKAALLYNPVNADFYAKGKKEGVREELGISAGSLLLMVVGMLHLQKNHQLAFEVLAELVEQGRQADLLVVGEGPHRELLEDEARNLGVSEYVHFLGYQRPERLRDLYAACDFILAPFVKEGFSGVVLEALAAGTLPVVSSGVGVRHFLKEQDLGELIAKPEKKEFLRLIERLLANGDMRGRLAGKGREAVKTLSWHNYCEDFEGLLRAVPPDVYTKEYYLSSCRGFEEFLRGEVSQRLLYAFALADLRKGMHILDVGTGRGELAVKCAEAGVHVKAIDYSQAAIEIARESLKRVGKEVAKGVVFERMNAKKISYSDKSFDVVFMIDVVEHLYPEELRLALLEIKRVLKPGGRMIIHTPNAWLIRWICFLAKIFFRWEADKEHVNGQSFFSLRRNLRLFGGRSRVYFRPRKECFSEPIRRIKRLPSWTIHLASFLDKILENKAVSFLIYHTPLVFFLGTDLWAVVEISSKGV